MSSIIHPTYIRTAMMAMVEGSKTFKSKMLEPAPVVDSIFKQIISGRSGHVYLPGAYSSVAGARGWPCWAQEALRNAQRDVFLLPFTMSRQNQRVDL